MRTLFFILFLTNIAYFSWHHFQAPKSTLNNPTSSSSTAKKQILLLSEKLSADNAPELEKNELNIEIRKTASESLGKRAKNTLEKCYQIGFFETQLKIDKWAENLDLDATLLQKKQKNTAIIKDYLVYYPAEKTFKASQKNISLLKKVGVRDVFLFKKGLFKGEIALGTLKTEAKAIQLQKELLEKKVSALIKPRYKTPPQFYVILKTNKTSKQLNLSLNGFVKKASIILQNDCSN